MSEIFDIVEQYEGLWCVSWPNLCDNERKTLLANLPALVFSSTNDEVGFSTRNGERAYTTYIQPRVYWQNSTDEFFRFRTECKCCMFTNKIDAGRFVEAAQKTLVWYTLTTIRRDPIRS